MPHDYDPESHYLVNLQHHVIHEKKLSEKEAVIIFWDIARIVEQLHKVSGAEWCNNDNESVSLAPFM